MRIKDVGRKVEFPKQPSVAYLSCLLYSPSSPFQHVQSLQPHPASERFLRQLRVGYPAGDRLGSSHATTTLSLSSRTGDDLSRHCGSECPSLVGRRPVPTRPSRTSPTVLALIRCSTIPSPTLPRGPHLCFGHHGRRTLGSPKGVASAQVPALCALLGRGYFDRSGSELGMTRRRGRFGTLPPWGGFFLTSRRGRGTGVTPVISFLTRI